MNILKGSISRPKFLLGGIIALALILSPCQASDTRIAPETFIVAPFEPNNQNLTPELMKLEVDRIVFYATNETCQPSTRDYFLNISKSGKKISLILTANISDEFNSGRVISDIKGNISYFEGTDQGPVAEYILWDDYLSRGGKKAKNQIARDMEEEFPNVSLGVILDMRIVVGNRSTRKLDNLTHLLSPYDFIVSYYYSYVEPGRELDPGEIERLAEAVELSINLTGELDPWFILRAHREQGEMIDKTTTINQMTFDLLFSRIRDFDCIGWFAIDIDEEGEAYPLSLSPLPDAWIRNSFLHVMLDLARRPTTRILWELYLDSEESAGELNNSVENIISNLTQTDQKVDTLNGTLTNLTVYLSDLNQSLNLKIGDLNSSLMEDRRRIENLSNSLLQIQTDFKSSIRQLEGNITSNMTHQLAQLYANISGSVSSNLSKISSKISTINSTIWEIKDLVENLPDIRHKVVECVARMKRMEGDITELQEYDKLIISMINQLERELEELQSLNEEVRTLEEQSQEEISSIQYTTEREIDALRNDMERMLKEHRASIKMDILLAIMFISAVVFSCALLVVGYTRGRLPES